MYAHQIHAFYIRHRDELRLPQVKTARINGTRAYHSLPRDIRSAIDLRMFKSLAKATSALLYAIPLMIICRYVFLLLCHSVHNM